MGSYNSGQRSPFSGGSYGRGGTQVWGDPNMGNPAGRGMPQYGRGGMFGGTPPGVYGDPAAGMGGPPSGVYGDPNLNAPQQPPTGGYTANDAMAYFNGLPPGSGMLRGPNDPRMAGLLQRMNYNGYGSGLEGFNPAQFVQQKASGQMTTDQFHNLLGQMNKDQRAQYHNAWGQFQKGNPFNTGASFDNQARVRGWIP